MTGNNSQSGASPEIRTETPEVKQDHKEQVQRAEHAERLDIPVSKATEYVESAESAEIAGDVSEVMSEKNEGDKAGGPAGGKKQVKRQTPAQIKAQLLKKAPSEEVMRGQIKKEIGREISYLQRRSRKLLLQPGSVQAYELNNIVKKIRELRSILVDMAKAAANMIKTLWLRFVHGVM
jgi:hypothetical protein